MAGVFAADKNAVPRQLHDLFAVIAEGAGHCDGAPGGIAIKGQLQFFFAGCC